MSIANASHSSLVNAPGLLDPVAPPSRSAWRALLGACAKTISMANPLALLDPELGRLDQQMAQAIRYQDTERFDSLLTETIDLRVALQKPFEFGSQSFESLTAAVETGGIYYLKALLRAGADPDAMARNHFQLQYTSRSESLAQRAVRSGQLPALALLIEAGADVNYREYFSGITAVGLAASLGDREACRLLIDAKAVVNTLDDRGRSPLQLALPYLASEETFDGTPKSHERLERLRERSLIAHDLLNAGATAADPISSTPKFEAPLPPLASALRLQDQALAAKIIKAGAPTDWLFSGPDAKTRDPAAYRWLQKADEHLPTRQAIVTAKHFVEALNWKERHRQPQASPPAESAELGSPAISPPELDQTRSILASRRAAKALREAPAGHPPPAGPQ